MDTTLADDIWELQQKFDSAVKPWSTDVLGRLKKFSDNSKLIVSGGDDDRRHTYTVKFMLPNFNYKDTEAADFWDPFIGVFADVDSRDIRYVPRSIWAKVERDAIMSHDEDQRLPGWPVTTLYDYEDGNSKMTESELCNFSKKHGDEWKQMAEQVLDGLSENFMDKYMDKEVDYYPPSSISPPSASQWNTPLISTGAKTLQGRVKKVSVFVYSDRKCNVRFLIQGNGRKKNPTPNIDAEGIRYVWG